MSASFPENIEQERVLSQKNSDQCGLRAQNQTIQHRDILLVASEASHNNKREQQIGKQNHNHTYAVVTQRKLNSQIVDPLG